MRGMSPTFSRAPRNAVNRLIAFAFPFGSVAIAEQLENGLHAAIALIVRIPPQSVDSTVKNYHWLDLIKGLYSAYDQSADTAILVDVNGNISEGPVFDMIAVSDGKTWTSRHGVLK
ncbi:hypothetical protein DEA8626_03749 [Defluviimonas aquaemixtae]|uniref:Uncharacterized protein n=1 Tax=Albidovulum aquaemixtae TaxID=1542388 RepID=A0A2R8BMN9_9RHOB|nr:aminotransferase class IV [Defluviimonas aquaemixtae]SPH24711.1 hypothetical protein DEA8626_03749 [Defluviimonas aquaemixtae]